METAGKTFAENFRECCARSCSGRAFRDRQADEAYTAASLECEALYETIRTKLGEDRKLINRFDTAKNNMFAADTEAVYQQGFQDCVYLLSWLGLL